MPCACSFRSAPAAIPSRETTRAPPEDSGEFGVSTETSTVPTTQAPAEVSAEVSPAAPSEAPAEVSPAAPSKAPEVSGAPVEPAREESEKPSPAEPEPASEEPEAPAPATVKITFDAGGGTFSLLIAAVIFHGIFNVLVQSEYRYLAFVWSAIMLLPQVVPIIHKKAPAIGPGKI